MDERSNDNNPHPNTEECSFAVDRRVVLGGLAALPAASEVLAMPATWPLRISHVRQLGKHNVYGIAVDLDERGRSQARASFVFYSEPFADQDGSGSAETPPYPRFVTRKLASATDGYSTVVAFNRIHVSDEPPYRMEWLITSRRVKGDDPDLIESNISAVLIPLENAAKQHRPLPEQFWARAPAVPLGQFLTGQTPLRLALNHDNAAQFIARMFGERMSIEKGRGAALLLHLREQATGSGATRLRKVMQPRYTLEEEPGPQAKFPFVAFSNTLQMRRLTIEILPSNQGEAARLQADYMEQAAAGRNNGRVSGTTWIGLAAPEDIRWRTEGAKKVPAVFHIRPMAPRPANSYHFEVSGADQPTGAVFRQWGRADETLAVVRGPLTARLKGRGDNWPDAVFHLDDALLSKRLTKPPGKTAPGTLDVWLRGALQDKPFAVDTAYGTLAVQGDERPKEPPPPPAVNGAAQTAAPPTADRKPQAGFPALAAKGLTQFTLRARQGTVERFDVRAHLTHFSLVLPEWHTADGTHPDLSHVWSRLDFHGTEIAFRLPLRTADNIWPSARSVVTLGEPQRPLPGLATNDASANPANVAADKAEQAKTDLAEAAPIQLALDGARLKARRDSDNLALNFGFVGFVLEVGKANARLVPNLRQAGMGRGKSAAGSAERIFDDRPLLIVDFPPQHVAEQAYYRRINDGVSLPEPLLMRLGQGAPADTDATRAQKNKEYYEESLTVWRKTGETQRRSELFDKLKVPSTPKDAYDEFLDLLRELGTNGDWAGELGLDPNTAAGLRARWMRLPEDQRLQYIGSNILATDPDVRSVLLSIRRAQINSTDPGAAELGDVRFHADLNHLPDSVLSTNMMARIDYDTKGQPEERRKRESAAKAVASREFDAAVKLAQAIGAKDKYSSIRQAMLHYNGPGAIANLYRNPPTPPGLPEADKATEQETYRKTLRSYVKELLAEVEERQQKEPFEKITPARLSGLSRLVFRFDTAGGTFDSDNIQERSDQNERKEATRQIAFSFEGLTDWGRFDLAVTRRAETLETYPGGRLPHQSLRGIDGDAARILAHQGITPGSSIQKRLREIRASLHRPEDHVTAIELPARLYLSPDQFARFRTTRPTPPTIFHKEGDSWRIPPTLWSTHLSISTGRRIVRAIWSDDFQADMFSGAAAPPEDNVEPWDPASGFPFRLPLSRRDRHAITMMSSVYGLQVMGRRDETQRIIDTSQIDPPTGYELDGLQLYNSPTGDRKASYSAIYTPVPLDISELRLTAHGASLRHDTSFVPPVPADRADTKAPPLFEAMSLERWRQYTFIGRDIEVEVVYKGYLYPLGVRAALIKLTERRFMRNTHDPKAVTAFLIQRKFIRIARPTKTFPALSQPDRGRRFPVNDLHMLTLETPDILDPVTGTPEFATSDTFPEAGRVGEQRSGGLVFQDKDVKTLPGMVFWPRVRGGTEGNFIFEYRLDGVATPIRMPLIFVDQTATSRPDLLLLLGKYYKADTRRSLRTVDMGGTRRRYVVDDNDGDSVQETFAWELRAEGRISRETNTDKWWKDKLTSDPSETTDAYRSDPFLQGADQPPFYPFVHQAKVRLGQIERFIGRELPMQFIRFEPFYQRMGLLQEKELKDYYSEGPYKDATLDSEEAARYYLRRYRAFASVYPEDLTTADDPDKVAEVNVDMAGNGDRSGAIGRFGGTFTHVCMPPAYLAPNLPPRTDPPLPAPAQPAPAAPQAPAIPAAPGAPVPNRPANQAATQERPDDLAKVANVFGKLEKFTTNMAEVAKGFKILGLISGEEAFGNISNRIMDLQETIHAATEETAKPIRKIVLPAVRRVVTKMDDMWTFAQEKMQAVPDQVALKLEDIYPEFSSALPALREKLERAEAADDIEILRAIVELMGAARRFVTALTHTLADPITPLKTEIRDKFRILSAGFANFGRDLPKAAIEALVDVLKRAITVEIKTVIDTWNVETSRGLLQQFIHFPKPPTLTPLTPAMAPQLAKALDAAAAAALARLITEIIAGKDPGGAIKLAYQAGYKALDATGLPAAVGAEVDKYKSHLQTTLGDIADIATLEAERLLVRLAGPALEFLVDAGEQARPFIPSREELAKLASLAQGGNIENLADALAGMVVKSAKAAIRPILIAQANQALATLCGTITGELNTIGKSLVPVAADVESAVTRFKTVLGSGGLGLNVSNAFSNIDDIVKRLKDLQTQLNGVISNVCRLPAPGQPTPRTVAEELLAGASADILRELQEIRTDLARDVIDLLLKAYEKLLNTAANAATESLYDIVFEAQSGLVKLLDSLDGTLEHLRDKLPAASGNTIADNAFNAEIGVLRDIITRERMILKMLKAIIRTLPAKGQNQGANHQALIQYLATLVAAAKGLSGASSNNLTSGFDRAKELARKAIEDERNALKDKAQEIRDAFEKAAVSTARDLETGLLAALEEAETRLIRFVGKLATLGEKTALTLVAELTRITAPIFKTANDNIYSPIQKKKEEISKTLGGDHNKIFEYFLKLVKSPNGKPINKAFEVYDSDGKTDSFATEMALLTALGQAATADQAKDYVDKAVRLFQRFEDQHPAPIRLIKQIAHIGTAILRGDVGQFIDLQVLRRELQDTIQKLIPTRITRSFELPLELGNVGQVVAFKKDDDKFKGFVARPHPKGAANSLVIKAGGTIDLLDPKKSTYYAEGYLCSCAIAVLKPWLDIVTIHLEPATFTASDGDGFHCEVKIENVVLGEMVKFIQDFAEAMMGPSGDSGYYREWIGGRPTKGLVIGYKLPPTSFSLGTMFIENLSLNVACQLPFDKSDARLMMRCSTPLAPFMISVAPYAGAGHVGLIANCKGIIGFEASLQFGGGGGFQFGPLTGSGRIMVGIFIESILGVTNLYGIFFAGGSARIACYSVSAQLYVRLGHENGNMSGEAIFTYSFSVGVVDIEFHVTVYKKEEGGKRREQKPSQPAQNTGRADDGTRYARSDVIDLSSDDYQVADDDRLLLTSGTGNTVAIIRNLAVCRAEDFQTYRQYFLHRKPARGRRSPATPGKTTAGSRFEAWNCDD